MLHYTEGREGKTLSVFHAPLRDRFTVPKEVLRVRSKGAFASKALWRLVTGSPTSSAYDNLSFEPCTIDQVGNSIDSFMREETTGGIFLDNEAPEEIRSTLGTVEENLTRESRQALTEFLGLDLQPEDDRPFPGQYL